MKSPAERYKWIAVASATSNIVTLNHTIHDHTSMQYDVKDEHKDNHRR